MRLKMPIYLSFCAILVCFYLFLYFFNSQDNNIQNRSYFSNSLWHPLEGQYQIYDNRIERQLDWMFQFKELANESNIKKKTILLFDTGVTLPNETDPIVCLDFEFNFCEVTRSVDIESPLDKMEQYDAVLFYYIHRTGNGVQNIIVPPGVKQVVVTLESPYKATADLGLNNAILGTYFWGSDIVLPYQIWVPYKNSTTTFYDKENNKEIWMRRAKIASIFVSNCDSRSNRLQIVRELKKFIPVDVYGQCGTAKANCAKNESRSECMAKTIQQYKFYLAFENANCRDYITEKVFLNAYGNNVVPVVMGAHPDDYKKALPKNSYIHVEDFASIKDLANFLILLNENDELYSEYFNWKAEGEFKDTYQPYFLCRVCGMLFYSDYVSHPVWSKTYSTWKSINKCLRPHRSFWK